MKHPALVESVVVTPSNAYTLDKHDDWTPPSVKGAKAHQWHATPTNVHEARQQEELHKDAGNEANDLLDGRLMEALKGHMALHGDIPDEEADEVVNNALVKVNHKLGRDYGLGFHHRKLSPQ